MPFLNQSVPALRATVDTLKDYLTTHAADESVTQTPLYQAVAVAASLADTVTRVATNEEPTMLQRLSLCVLLLLRAQQNKPAVFNFTNNPQQLDELLSNLHETLESEGFMVMSMIRSVLSQPDSAAMNNLALTYTGTPLTFAIAPTATPRNAA